MITLRARKLTVINNRNDVRTAITGAEIKSKSAIIVFFLIILKYGIPKFTRDKSSFHIYFIICLIVKAFS